MMKIYLNEGEEKIDEWIIFHNHILALLSMGNIFLISHILSLLMNSKILETWKKFVILFSGPSDD